MTDEDMKTIEEKAKAYDIALERAKEWSEGKYGHSVADTPKDIAEYLFPELAESDDEKTRKQIMEHIMWSEDNGNCATEEKERWIAWLEKQGEQKVPDVAVVRKELNEHLKPQGEQKPAEWSEENKFWMAVEALEDAGKFDLADWLKSLRERVQPQPKQEWSEDEKRILDNINLYIRKAHDYPHFDKENIEEAINWLKSLRPQNWTKEDKERYISCLQRLSTGNPEQPETINSKWFKEHVYHQSTWKPSDGQIKVCKEVYADILSAKGFDLGTINSELNRLEEELKKLKEK